MHINDGSMGGGGPIPYEDKVSWDDFKTDYIGLYSDYNKYFSKERVGIFHYCLYGQKREEKPNQWGTSQTGGSSWCAYFAIWDTNINSIDNEVHTFIHELGHNLLGRSINDPDSTTYNPKADYLEQADPDEYWSHHQEEKYKGKCAMRKSSDELNYCDKCWNALDLSGSLNGWPIK